MHNESNSGTPGDAGRFSDLERPGLDVRALRRALCPPSGPFARVELVEEIASTNEQLAGDASADQAAWPDLSVLTTDYQSAGAGRRGRGWATPPRSAVLVSVLLRPGQDGPGWPADAYGWLPLLGGLAAAEALADVAGLDTGVKWPNDVLVREGEKKLVGVLARALTIDRGDRNESAVVLGAGINVSLSAAELPVETATSVELAGGSTTDRDTILRAYLRRAAYWYAAMRETGGDAESAGLAAAVRENTMTIGRDVVAELPGGERLTGRARAMDDAGRLVIIDPAGVPTSLAAGDVVHLRAGDL
ncbi:biotin--[acetyl-CoA-carboxylase] ligase [Spelaeicoccus albus]|uniref:biotin--[biotin carboxyl-carrier protein] ligase n=1 Tax=Spelaeicoccus albus TaxID=1280376 RepID=A0A7Z0IHW4_9MICO|nr:biotin--[acetyl-CoA-carboxylase] ligase [Spelaeicoccus albus]NYI67911.1 BirA family biotin operon repressor/biotin-[acetyl-CoA-carboxylase] ligase [Spelaeicoccus albus]